MFQRMSNPMYANQTISPIQHTQPVNGVLNDNSQNNIMEVIRSGDSTRGEQIANNLLAQMGLTKEEAIAQARTFFGL